MNEAKIKYFIFSLILSLVFAVVFIQSGEIYKGFQNAWYFYFVGIVSITVMIVSLNFLLSKKKFKISFNPIDLFLLLFLLYSFLRLLFTQNEILSNQQFIILLFLVIFYFIWKGFLKKNFTKGRVSIPAIILISAFLMSGLLEAVIGILQLYDVLPGYVNSYFKVNGTFVNPANFAGYLSSVIPFSFGMYILSSKNVRYGWIKHLSLAVFLSSLFILPVLRQRSSWVAVSGGILVIFYYKYKIKNGKDTLLKIKNVFNTAAKKTALIFLILFLLSLFSFSLYSLKPNSANGRFLMWKLTTRMIRDNPLFGAGFDRFKTEYDKYQADYFEDEGSEYEKLLADNVMQAHNEFLQIWAELGLVGLIIFGCIIVFSLWGYKKNDLPPPDSDINVLIISAKASLVSILIFSLFYFPFHILPTFINFIFLLSLISACFGNIVLSSNELNPFNSPSLTKRRGQGISLRQPFLASLALALLIFSGFILVTTYKLSNSYKVWKQANLVAYPGLYNDSIKMFKSVYPELKDNGEFLFNYGGILTLNKNYKEAAELLEESKKNYTDPKQYINLGVCYENLKNYEKAENNYKYASDMIPNLFYPKYLLAKLFVKEKKIEEAKILSKEILESKAKIRSTAVKQMKEEIRILFASFKKPVIYNKIRE